MPPIVSETVEIAGEQLIALPERALLWERTATLLLADLHLGKDEVFRRAGIAVPAGPVSSDLTTLTGLVQQHGVRRVVLLGDFVHAAPSAGSGFITEFLRWREAHALLDFIVVAGNHDRRAAEGVLGEAVRWQQQWRDGPFVGRHHPGESPDGYVLCGHVHPVLTVRARRERMRLPVFWFTPSHGVLPSFGSFTGGAEIDPGPGDQVFAAAAGRVWRVPLAR